MSAPDIVCRLVDRFHDQLSAYKRNHYNETQLRRDFLDPFYESLGWDVTNRKALPENTREVIHEASVEVEGHAKAADYAFRVGKSIAFFVEAKKPSVEIDKNPLPAFQVKTYAWSARLPVSLLTDFEQLAVYDCRAKPRPGDLPAFGRERLYAFPQYVEKWDELYALFSRDAVYSGSLDDYASRLAAKKGLIDVDDSFLEELERWRELLARNIALRNPHLSSRDINHAVQTTIDRIVFLRICEDRGIEPDNALKDATDGVDVYGDLLALFRRADQKYNSGLFHFSDDKYQSSPPDTLTPTVRIDDKALKDILKNLYYPASPYAFKYISADILGQVYERFLGKVIRLTDGHQAKVEEKPEVRKAGGVYYTPTYIVDYIVKHTLGEKLKNETPETQAKAPLRVLDPACGSGSFLLGAYQYLLDWYLGWYVANDPTHYQKGKSPAVIEGRDGWQLTIEKKKHILLAHIFGVDIDAQAVEVTKLSLLLKAVEAPGQLSLLNERILPDLGQNIRCGNSLISMDYYDTHPMPLFPDDAFYRVNAFDWRSAFPHIFTGGGFDVVIGNPPYIRQETIKEQKDYYQTHFRTYQGTADLYTYFIERGISLLNEGGRFGYIVANKWMRASYGASLRKWLGRQGIVEIIDFADLPVFEGATTYPCILITQKGSQIKTADVTKVKSLDFRDLHEYQAANHYSILIETLDENSWSLSNQVITGLLEKIKSSSILLGSFVDNQIYYGIKTALNEAFVIDSSEFEQIILEEPQSKELIRPFLMGRDIKRYQSPESKRYLILIPKGWTNKKKPSGKAAWTWFQAKYPVLSRHLATYSKAAEQRQDKGDYWWELRACDYYEVFERPKLLLPDISLRGNFMFDSKGEYYCVNTAYIMASADFYLLGILNSKLTTFIYRTISSSYQGGYLRFIFQYLVQLPIRKLNMSNPTDAAAHARMVTLVETMLALHKQPPLARLPQEIELIQRQIAATDRAIDRLVYDLYNLTPEEIALVESA